MQGLILINKPQDMTSFDVVAVVRKTLNIKKIGHAGTLDPNAEGLLIILVDKATKALPFLALNRKTYLAQLRFGIKTNTGDIWGDVIDRDESLNIDESKIDRVLKSFLGITKQTPPKVSAISIKGKRLYEYARANIDVEIPEREIEIFNIEKIAYEEGVLTFKVECSSGTYIRSLCEDIAIKLDTLGTMQALTRTSIGQYQIEDAIDITTLRNGDYRLLPVIDAIELDKVEVENVVDVKNGKTLNLKHTSDEILITHQNELIAVYHYREEDGLYHCVRGLW
ncbi:MAG TPA: tRNA pseudouridine(55) synthase TruB [Erysipelotrichaceae bacterium]|nr:tRNA pseudouridine(55) synthase TruB [Erysipelotrichaceae bacterium]